MPRENKMTTREAVLSYGLSLPDTYQDAPFHDENWQLVRVRKSKKVLNKEHWNTVILDGTVPDEDVKRMIAESYDLIVARKKVTKNA